MNDPQLFVSVPPDTAASRVQLCGHFTNWEPRYGLRGVRSRHLTITVPLKQGVHDYLVVDGQRWVP